MKDWDYSYLSEALRDNKFQPSSAMVAEASIVIERMSKEIMRLQALVYLTPEKVCASGQYLMFRTDDSDNIDGIPCEISEHRGRYYIEYPNGDNQNILTLDSEVRFQKV